MTKRSLKRQFRDVVAMAHRLKETRNPDGDLEAFSSFVRELKTYIQTHTENKAVLKKLAEIPELDYQQKRPGLFGNLMMAMRGGYINPAQNEAIADAQDIAGQFSTIEFLLAGEFDEV